MKFNFGSKIEFTESHKGTEKGIKYKWTASAHYCYPETIFINKYDNFWFKIGDNQILRALTHVFSHEPIHNIINYEILVTPAFSGYDKLRIKFVKKIKKECPSTYRKYTLYF